MEKNGETRLFLQELLELHLELFFIFFERHLHFLSMQYHLPIPAYFQTLSLRLTEEIVNLRAHHVPRCSCCQQLWYHCEHTAAQVGLPSCPTDKAQKSWHQRRLLGHFWGAGRLRSRTGTLITTFVPISTAGSLELVREAIFWVCCSWPDFAPSRAMLIRFFLTQRLQVTFSPKPSLSSL